MASPGCRPSGITVDAIAAGLGALLLALDVSPAVAVGHSAGAAILARLVLSGRIAAPAVLVALNGAMLPIPGLAGHVFRSAARLLASAPALPWIVSRRVRRQDVVERLIANTGSRLDGAGLDSYARLMGSPEHVRNMLLLLANWDLRQMLHELPRLPCRLVLVAAERDRAVPPGSRPANGGARAGKRGDRARPVWALVARGSPGGDGGDHPPRGA